MTIKKIISLLAILMISILLIIFSLYSVTYKSWIWENGTTWQRILGTLSGLAAFTGVLATLLFWKRKKRAYVFAVANALLFGMFALSINLTGDFLVNLFWILPSLFITLILTKKGEMAQHRFTWRSITIYIILFAGAFTFFILVTPYINESWSKTMHLNNFGYGINFNYYWPGRILDTTMNSLTVVGIILMIRGYKEVWYLWFVKNIIAICFFGGIAVIDVSIIIMNAIYTIMIFFIISENKRKKTLRVAIIGPGAVGKTTVIKDLKPFLEKNDMPLFDEREGVITDDFSAYMADMKGHAYKMQKEFFKTRLKQLESLSSFEKGMMDRHSTDDFLFSQLHINVGNFSKEQSRRWQRIDFKRFWWKLESLPQLDILFVLMGTDEMIESRREKRSSCDEVRKHEIKNKKFFREANAMYHDTNSIMYKAFKFSKRQVIIENKDSHRTAKKITKILEANLDI